MVRISDATLKQNISTNLSFREKTELIRILDRLHADVIELGEIKQEKADTLFIKTAADTVTESTISVTVSPDISSVDQALSALQQAKQKRIQISAPVSLVQMEYLYHSKPEKMMAAVTEAISHAVTMCEDVEFEAVDATRAERDFLYEILRGAIEAGANTVTVCDTAGNALPQEAAQFIREIRENVAGIENVTLAVSCSDQLAMADACTTASMIAGAGEVKASIYPQDMASLKNVAAILQKKGGEYHISSSLRTVEIKRLYDQAARMFTDTRSKTSPFDSGVREDGEGRYFTGNDDIAAVIAETKKLGYDLSEEDQVLVFDEFRKLSARKEQVTPREIDAIVASTAMQVPPSFIIENFSINASNVFGASAHIRLKKDGELVESVALGDGPVDASFLAIEQIIGHHYELDDFQIRSVTEGREAMGEAVVKLRSGGRVYSGRGLSTDIIGSSISAYINALNKIVYEEAGE